MNKSFETPIPFSFLTQKFQFVNFYLKKETYGKLIFSRYQWTIINFQGWKFKSNSDILCTLNIGLQCSFSLPEKCWEWNFFRQIDKTCLNWKRKKSDMIEIHIFLCYPFSFKNSFETSLPSINDWFSSFLSIPKYTMQMVMAIRQMPKQAFVLLAEV